MTIFTLEKVDTVEGHHELVSVGADLAALTEEAQGLTCLSQEVIITEWQLVQNGFPLRQWCFSCGVWGGEIFVRHRELMSKSA